MPSNWKITLNELRVTRSWKFHWEGKGGTGARESCKNFVREECKQCPVRVARLFPSLPIFYSPPLYARVSFSSWKFATVVSSPSSPIEQLHPRKSGRQFVNPSFWISSYLIALTCSLLNPDPQFRRGFSTDDFLGNRYLEDILGIRN